MTGQVAAWLEKVGLPQYLKPFSDYGIDFVVLPEITDRDLESMGVLLGHRRKLLRSTVPNSTRQESEGGPAECSILSPNSGLCVETSSSGPFLAIVF